MGYCLYWWVNNKRDNSLLCVGTIFANCIACGVYSTNSPEACLYVAQNSDAQIIVIQNLEIYQKYEPYLKQLNLVKAIVLYNETNLPEEMVVPVYLWEDFINLGRKFKESIHDTLQERINKQNPGNCCSLFYTSGTTTLAKGVMLSHDNLLYGIEEIFYEFSGSRESQIHERIISYLPLSHVAAFVCDVITNFTIGATVTFAKPDALKGSLLKTMKIIRPTIFFAVPRVWEKIEQQIKTISAKKATLLKIIGTDQLNLF
jgi:long-chain-fatty-acid--CoA ligase ACSBG